MNNIAKSNKIIIQKENLEKFLCEEQKEKIKDAVLIKSETNIFLLKIRDNDGSENIYFFFKEPTLVILIKGENEIEFNLFFDNNEFENFINSFNNSTVYYIQDNNLKSFYLKDKKNFIENKEKTTNLLLLDNLNQISYNDPNLILFCEDINNSKLISASSISPIFSYYNLLNNEQIEKNILIKTNIRMKLEEKILYKISRIKGAFGLTGGKGIGKSAFMLYICGLDYLNCFLVNLHCVFRRSINSTKNAFKIEVLKMMNGCKDNFAKDAIENFYNLIDKFIEPDNIFDFLLNFVKILNEYI